MAVLRSVARGGGRSWATGSICTWMNNARTEQRRAVAGPPNPAWGDVSSDRLGYDGAGRAITKRYLAGGINDADGYTNPTARGRLHHRFRPRRQQVLRAAPSCRRTRPSLRAVRRQRLADRRLRFARSPAQVPARHADQTGGSGGAGGGDRATPITLPNTDTAKDLRPRRPGQLAATRFSRPRAGHAANRSPPAQRLEPDYTPVKNGATRTNLSYDGATGESNGNLANDGTLSYTLGRPEPPRAGEPRQRRRARRASMLTMPSIAASARTGCGSRTADRLHLQRLAVRRGPRRRFDDTPNVSSTSGAFISTS